MKPDLLIVNEMPSEFLDALREGFSLHVLSQADDRTAFLADVASRIRGVVTSGSFGIDRTTIEALPRLEIICCMSAGYDKVDMKAARDRRITVTHGVGINSNSVADNALCLLLAVVRNLLPAVAYVRAGGWPEKGRPPATPTITGKKLGILGLGDIGFQIARRASSFDMEISYHNRKRRSDVPYRYVAKLMELAGSVDYLMVSCPGGRETFHMVDSEVLAALGCGSVLVNIARGSIVDTAALVSALENRTIAGAGLDVLEDEPQLLEKLLRMDNVLVTPHISAPTVESRTNMKDQLLSNLRAHFSGAPVLTPVL